MLSPRYLAGIGDELADIYAQLEADILADMARRIARLGKITESTKWQARMLAETGALRKRVRSLIKKYDPAIQKEILAVYNDAMVKNARADNRIFEEALGHGVSDSNAQAMLAGIEKTYSDLSRLTLTTAFTTEQQFVQQANNAYMQVVSGAFDYDSAMKNACDKLAADGVYVVQYRNGEPVKFNIEAAVRMNILTGVNQTAAQVTLDNCEELGCDLVETSAHIGARPEHQEWQGKVFSLSGNNKKYPPFSVCGLGTVTGICGVNCRHSYYPYFEGTEKHYSAEDLDELAGQTVEYNGVKMTRYEGEEKLRYIERNIRQYKRRALTEQSGGVDDTASRRKVGEWQAAARDFTKQTGIARDSAREFVGTIDGQQPRGLKLTETPKIITKTPKAPEVQPIPAAPQNIATIQTTEQKIKALVDNPKSQARVFAETYRIKSQPVMAYLKQPTENEIITRLAGADKTSGSCSSLANAYIANKGGFDVLDFRGGESLDLFAKKSTSLEMAKFNGVESYTVIETNQIKAGNKLLSYLEVGKEYKLGVGSHAAIVRKLKDGTKQYLELQSAGTNGWKNFTNETFKNRFNCKIRRKYYQEAYLIELESLSKNREFIELMQYLNTSESAQLKGIGGYAK